MIDPFLKAKQKAFRKLKAKGKISLTGVFDRKELEILKSRLETFCAELDGLRDERLIHQIFGSSVEVAVNDGLDVIETIDLILSEE